jgi:hypothetical protein
MLGNNPGIFIYLFKGKNKVPEKQQFWIFLYYI